MTTLHLVKKLLDFVIFIHEELVRNISFWWFDVKYVIFLARRPNGTNYLEVINLHVFFLQIESLFHCFFSSSMLFSLVSVNSNFLLVKLDIFKNL